MQKHVCHVLRRPVTILLARSAPRPRRARERSKAQLQSIALALERADLLWGELGLDRLMDVATRAPRASACRAARKYLKHAAFLRALMVSI